VIEVTPVFAIVAVVVPEIEMPVPAESLLEIFCH